jgi:hypothetical protein
MIRSSLTLFAVGGILAASMEQGRRTDLDPGLTPDVHGLDLRLVLRAPAGKDRRGHRTQGCILDLGRG